MWWIRANNRWDTLISKNKNHVVLHPLNYINVAQKHIDSIVYTPIGELIRSKDTLYGFVYSYFQKNEVDAYYMDGFMKMGGSDSIQFLSLFCKCTDGYQDYYTGIYEDSIYFDKTGIALIVVPSRWRYAENIKIDDEGKGRIIPHRGFYYYERTNNKKNKQYLLKGGSIEPCNAK